MKLVHKLKYRFSYSYRLRCGAGLTAIRNDREYKAIIAFCTKELLDKKHMRLNPERRTIYQTTVKLHEQGDASYHKPVKIKLPFHSREIIYMDAREFIDDYVSWYWN